MTKRIALHGSNHAWENDRGVVVANEDSGFVSSILLTEEDYEKLGEVFE